jgi:hypothetical protein
MPRQPTHHAIPCLDVAKLTSLHGSEITVKVHRGQVMRKMKARSMPDLVRKAESLGIEPRLPHGGHH